MKRQLLINILLLIIVLFSIYVSFKINLEDRSLWLDEAMLAFSFSQRGLSNLTSEIFEWVQSSPVLYLYIVKTITLIFGNTEFTLRIWSFISFILTLIGSYYLLNSILNIKVPLLGVALIAGLPIMLIYSNEFKPYMTDCACIVFLIISAFLYSQKKISRLTINIIYASVLWLSNPVCFFIGAFLLIELIEGLQTKQYDIVKKSIISGGIVLISFVVYFFYWLKPVIDEGTMTDFWSDRKFPLIPTSIADIKTQISLITELLIPFGYFAKAFLLIIALGVLINLFKSKNRYINAISLGILISLFASMFGLFPFVDRLYLFVYPLLAILFMYSVNYIYSNKILYNELITIIILVLILSTNCSLFYNNSTNIYRTNEEFNFTYYYVLNNLKQDDQVYIYYHSIPVFLYKNKYDSISIGKFKNNLLLGKGLFNNGNNTEDIDLLKNNSSVYILASHAFPFRINPLLDSLNTNGTFKEVFNKYGTPVYHYTKEKN